MANTHNLRCKRNGHCYALCGLLRRSCADLRIVGTKVDSPIKVPHYLGPSSEEVKPGLAKLFPNATVYFDSIGQSGGGGHGFNVFTVRLTVEGLKGKARIRVE